MLNDELRAPGTDDEPDEPEPLRSGVLIVWAAGAMVIAALIVVWLVTR